MVDRIAEMVGEVMLLGINSLLTVVHAIGKINTER